MRYPSRALALAPLALYACTPAAYRQEADDQVYGILEKANAKVTGNATVFNVDRPVDTLRARLLSSKEPVRLTLLQALDVAAENSFSFQSQKERLYLTALALTQRQNDFAIRWGGGGGGGISGTGDDEVDVDFNADLSASVRTVAGTQIVASFVNNLLRSLLSGGGFDGSSILQLTLTQPLLQGSGVAVVREPLTQAERNVVYAVRDFERFRRAEAVRIVTQYWGVLEQMRNLDSLDRDLTNRQTNYDRASALFDAGRGSLDDVDRANTDLLRTRNSVVTAQARLQTSLDNFKRTLGLSTDAEINLVIDELDNLEDFLVPVDLEWERAVELALSRRFDYQTALDNVDDAARRVIVAEDALKSALDFSSAVTVPTDPDNPFELDWSEVRWAAGFDLDLALNKLPERNAYRSALISLDVAIRTREQLSDQIKAEVRLDLRDIQQLLQNYQIDLLSLQLAERRVESTRDLYQAGRVRQIDVNDAQDALTQSRLNLVGSLVDYSSSRLVLMNDLEALILEPQGLRFDPGLPLPTGPMLSDPNNPENPAIASGPGSEEPEGP